MHKKYFHGPHTATVQVCPLLQHIRTILQIVQMTDLKHFFTVSTLLEMYCMYNYKRLSFWLHVQCTSVFVL